MTTISRRYLFGFALCLCFQQTIAGPMPVEWGPLKVNGTFEDGCPNISGEYEDIGEMAKDNPTHPPYDTRELMVLFPFYAKTPVPLVKFIFKQDDSQLIETIAVGSAGDAVKRAYVRGNNEHEGNNNFDCKYNAIVFKERMQYSGEQGKGVTNSNTQVMLALDGALIVHQIVQKQLTSLLIFTSNRTDEYWWRFRRKGSSSK